MNIAVNMLDKLVGAVFSKRGLVVLALVVLVLVVAASWKNWKPKADEGEDPGVMPAQEAREGLRALARQLHSEIHGITTWTQRAETMNRAADLSDPELRYLADHYKDALGRGVSLYQDVDDEQMPFTGADERLMARLRVIGRY